MVHSGKLRAVVRTVTDRDPGGLYAPDNICTKPGRRVLDVLREKHPDARIPEESAFDFYTNSAELLEVMPIASYEEQISCRRRRLRLLRHRHLAAAAAAANPVAVPCRGHPHHVTHVVAGGDLPSTTGNGGSLPHQL